ncbi:MAG: CTP synthase, partial [Candidatus Methylomirabilales bacterium]
EGLDNILVEILNLDVHEQDLRAWEEIVEKVQNPSAFTTIAVVGKYLELKDAYKSLTDAISHGGIANDCRVEIRAVEAERIEEEGPKRCLNDVAGILVPGGFGIRGIEGKITAITYAREEGIPFLGICLGMQCAVIEFARHVCGLREANSREFDPETPHPVIDLMPEQRGITNLGGTMRLGAYPCRLRTESRAFEAYGTEEVSERHRHRYEVNNEYRSLLENHGLVNSGVSPDEKLVELVELAGHPWFVGCQFHPEFRSRPKHPHPLFRAFIRATLEHRKRP